MGAQEGTTVTSSAVSAGTAKTGPGLFDWQVADAQDSIRFTDSTSSGSVEYSWSSYYPYGQGAVPVTGTLTGGTSLGTGTGENDLLADADALPGGRTYLDKQIQPDRSLGLDHRTYQANLDVLTTPDPELDTSTPLAFNPYAYSHNNPIGQMDPSGLGAVNADGTQAYCSPTTQTCDPNDDPTTTAGSTPAGSSQAGAGLPKTVQQTVDNGVEQGASEQQVLQTILDATPPGPSDSMMGQVRTYYCARYSDAMCDSDPSLLDVLNAATWFVAPEAAPEEELAVHGLEEAAGPLEHAAEGLLGKDAAGGVEIGEAKFAQKSFSETFSRGGRFSGQSINEVASSLRSGALSPKDVPIDVITRDGNTLILNTRSSQALIRAGIPRSSWTVIDRTGQATYEARLSGQLSRNGLTSSGTDLP